MAATPHTDDTTASPLDRHAPPVADHHTSSGTKNGKATASMILGIIALPAVLLFWPLALVLGIVGLTLGIMARGQIKRTGMQGSGQAMAGIVCSGIALALVVVLFVIVGIALNNS